MGDKVIISEHLAVRYKQTRARTEEICRRLEVEDYVVQPIVDVSPPKWHLGHSTWFFETFVLSSNARNYKVYNNDFNFIFNSYYESVGKRVIRTERGNLTRPTVEDVYKYRQYVDEAILEFLEVGNTSEEVDNILELGLQHEQQHQELLLTDIKYILGHNPLFPVYKYTDHPKTVSDNGTLNNYFEFDEGVYEIGYTGSNFCFDNEKGVHKAFLHSFRVMDRLITNGEYLEFMEAGGYSDFKWWLQEGWEFVKINGIQAPLYWHKIENKWHFYTLSGIKEINLNEPVTHISFYEAEAFARWKNKRLLTEVEWETVSKSLNLNTPKEVNFYESGFLHPSPRRGSHNQLLGDAWEWTNSAYLPYPYYGKAEGALGEYNGKFMINQMVLRGGSCASPKNHIRVTYRNFFHPDKRWQFTGIRLAENL